MASNKDESMFVQCPYYKHESKCVIYCEGVQDECCIHIAFATRNQKKDYQRQFCEKCWCKCMIASAHNRKWGYEA